ncbi:hypothetical protein [Mycoplasma sp. Z1473D]
MKKYLYVYHTGSDLVTLHNFAECEKVLLIDKTLRKKHSMFHCSDCEDVLGTELSYSSKTKGTGTYWIECVANMHYYSFVIYFLSDELLKEKKIKSIIQNIYKKNILNCSFNDMFWSYEYGKSYAILSPFIGNITSIENYDKEIDNELCNWIENNDGYWFGLGGVLEFALWNDFVKSKKKSSN